MIAKHCSVKKHTGLVRKTNKKATAKFTSNLRGKSELNLCIEDHSKIVAVGHSDLGNPYRSGTVNELHIVPPQMRLLHFFANLPAVSITFCNGALLALQNKIAHATCKLLCCRHIIHQNGKLFKQICRKLAQLNFINYLYILAILVVDIDGRKFC